MPGVRARAGTTEVYRREGELDCIKGCMAGGGPNQEMKGCCTSFLTLRQGTMAFAGFEVIWKVIVLIVSYPPWKLNGFGGDTTQVIGAVGILMGCILTLILILTSVMGVFGAFSRNPGPVNIFIWSFVYSIPVLLVVSVLLVIWQAKNFLFIVAAIVEIPFVWWLFVIGNSLKNVLLSGGSGDERNAKNILVSRK